MLKGEDILQSNVCKILDFCRLPYFAIPNGIYIKKTFTKWKFTVTGRKSGVPDLFICRPFWINTSDEAINNGLIPTQKPGCFIECKNGKNAKLFTEQRQWMALLIKEGYAHYVVREVKDIYKVIIACYPEESKRIHNINKIAL